MRYTWLICLVFMLLGCVQAESNDKCSDPDDQRCTSKPKKKVKKRKFRKEIKMARKQIRRIGVMPIELPFAQTIPRVSVEDLNKPENSAYLNRLRPFILTGAMDGWKGLERWQLHADKTPHFNRYFRRDVVDFYPYNMLKSGTHPYLMRFGAGIRELMNPPGRYTDAGRHAEACEQGCRYLHLQLTPKTWKTLEAAGDIPPESKRHKHTGGDEWWMRRCLADSQVREEYHIKTHWKIILIGSEGAGMFNHSDSLQSASWHGHIQGRKWWYVSGMHEGQHMAMESVLLPGEILYYGKNWHHHTRNLETPTSTITGTVVTADNFPNVAEMLFSECSRNALQFDLSGALCDALDDCYPLWHKILRGKAGPAKPKWRDVASADIIKKRDGTKPTDNNYDGRNYIGE